MESSSDENILSYCDMNEFENTQRLWGFVKTKYAVFFVLTVFFSLFQCPTLSLDP